MTANIQFRTVVLTVAAVATFQAVPGMAQTDWPAAPATFEEPVSSYPLGNSIEKEIHQDGAADSVARENTSLPLRPRPSSQTDSEKSTGGTSIVTVFGSLAFVLGAFFAVAWVMRRGLPGASGALPREAVEVLGQTAIGPRQQAQLIRLGERLLLVSLTATGAATLAEISDPAEVARLTALCKPSRRHDSSDAAKPKSRLGRLQRMYLDPSAAEGRDA